MTIQSLGKTNSTIKVMTYPAAVYYTLATELTAPGPTKRELEIAKKKDTKSRLSGKATIQQVEHQDLEISRTPNELMEYKQTTLCMCNITSCTAKYIKMFWPGIVSLLLINNEVHYETELSSNGFVGNAT